MRGAIIDALQWMAPRMSVEVVVLAAGAGVRMRSGLPKVLHPLGGRPLLDHVLDTARSLEPSQIHVVAGGEHGDKVKDCFAEVADLSWVRQEPPRGTGHAVAEALPVVSDESTVLVLFGDAPLTTVDTVKRCVQGAGEGIALATAVLDDPFGFGRILRDGEKRIVGIVEERDASDAEKAITEVNTGILAAPKRILADLVGALRADNDQGEYYLTDVVSLAVARAA